MKFTKLLAAALLSTAMVPAVRVMRLARRRKRPKTLRRRPGRPRGEKTVDTRQGRTAARRPGRPRGDRRPKSLFTIRIWR